jgi:hypothetical protein
MEINHEDKSSNINWFEAPNEIIIYIYQFVADPDNAYTFVTLCKRFLDLLKGNLRKIINKKHSIRLCEELKALSFIQNNDSLPIIVNFQGEIKERTCTIEIGIHNDIEIMEFGIGFVDILRRYKFFKLYLKFTEPYLIPKMHFVGNGGFIECSEITIDLIECKNMIYM